MSPQSNDPSVTQQVRLDAICMRFEQAWRRGEQPRIESYLNEVPAGDRHPLQLQLVLVELEHLEQTGHAPSLADYLARFPQDSAPIRRAFDDHAQAPSRRNSIDAPIREALAGHPQNAVHPAGTVEHEPIAERLGSQIGRYKLLEQIGEGGMGVVYMAEQLKPVRRKVALKIIKPGMDTKQVVARFEAERQALAMMDHTNIARVFDAGSTESGRPFFVMELVRGVPITEYCDKNKLPARERLELFISVCQAVQHAHTKGIIHRDLKPTNVLVTLHDGVPVPKIIDFGVAKATGQQLTERTLFTGFAQMVGTPLYMSPEQAEMSGLDIDTRSDIYSLGVLLYELLTGATPFDRHRFHTAAYDELRRIIQEEEPEKPSTRVSTMGQVSATISASRSTDPARLKQLLRGELDWIIMKALEKDRSRRYETASALVAEVNRYLDGEPVEAGPPSATYRLRKFARRHQGQVAVATGFLLLLLASSVVAWLLYAATLQARNQAVAAQAELTVERDRAVEAEQAARDERDRAESETQRADRHAGELKQRLYDYSVIKADTAFNKNNPSRALALLDDCLADQRHWEWHRLRGLVEQAGLVEHKLAWLARSMAVSPVEARLAIGDGTVRIMDMETGKSLWRQSSDHQVAHDMRFSPDGRLLATIHSNKVLHGVHSVNAGFRSTLQVWETESGKLVWETTRQATALSMVEFSPDSRQLVVGRLTTDPVRVSVQTHDVASGDELWSIPTKGLAISSAFSPDGTRLYLSGWTSNSPAKPSILSCLNIEERAEVWSKRRDVSSCVALSRDGSQLITGGANHSLQIWDAVTGAQLEEKHANQADTVVRVSLSRDGKQLVSRGNQVQVAWDWQTKQPLRSIRSDQKGRVPRPTFSFDDAYVVSLDALPGGSIQFLRPVAQPQPELTLSGHESRVWGLAFAPDGKQLVSAGQDGTLRTWNAATGQELRTRIVAPERATAVAYAPDGRYIATGGSDGAKLWDAESGKLVHHLPTVGETWWIKFSPDGRRLVGGGSSQTVEVWELTGGSRLLSHRTTGKIDGLVFCADNETVVALHDTGKLEVIDVESGETRELRGSMAGSLSRCLVRHPQTNIVAAALRDTIELWDIDQGRRVRSLSDSVGVLVRSLVFSRDGTRLFSGDDTGVVKVWNVDTGEQLFSQNLHKMLVWSLSLSPDGTTLASAGNDGLIRVSETTRPSLDIADRREIVRAATDAVNQRYRLSPSLRDVLASLTSDASLDKQVLQTAIEIANSRGNRPSAPQATAASAMAQLSINDLSQQIQLTKTMFVELAEDKSGIKVSEKNLTSVPAGAARDWHDPVAALADDARFSPKQRELLLQPLIQAYPQAHHFVYIRGHAHARRGEWRDAARDLAASLERVPPKSPSWHRQAYDLASLYLFLDELPQYEVLCRQFLADFGADKSTVLAERTAKIHLLRPDRHADLEPALALADFAIEDDSLQAKSLNHWFSATKGIADYRREQFQEAITRLDHAAQSRAPVLSVLALSFKSMCLHELEAATAARETLAAADQILHSDALAQPDGDTFPGNWNDWINAQLAYREALQHVAVKDDKTPSATVTEPAE